MNSEVPRPAGWGGSDGAHVAWCPLCVTTGHGLADCHQLVTCGECDVRLATYGTVFVYAPDPDAGHDHFASQEEFDAFIASTTTAYTVDTDRLNIGPNPALALYSAAREWWQLLVGVWSANIWWRRWWWISNRTKSLGFLRSLGLCLGFSQSRAAESGCSEHLPTPGVATMEARRRGMRAA